MKDQVLIKLEIESMKAGIIHALNGKHLELNSKIDEAVEKFLATPHLEQAVERELKAVIDSEIKSFFAYGDGRKIIAGMVQEKLKGLVDDYETIKKNPL